MEKSIKKISVLGGPGTGKSTLAKNLGKEFNLPVYHLDGMHFKDNWVERDKEERDSMIMDVAQQDEWVIDGNYKKTLDYRIKQADKVIFLDYSTFAKMKGIYGRYFECRGKERGEIPGCKEKMDFEFVKHTFLWNRKVRSHIKGVLDENESSKIMVFKNRKQLNRWFEEKFNKKIKKSIDTVE